MPNVETSKTTPLQLARACVRRLIPDEGVTAGIFFAVLATAILAFGLGATADIVVSMLIVGTVTAFAEARLRARK